MKVNDHSVTENMFQDMFPHLALPNDKYKDRLFRRIFSEKAELLSLYNAVNGTSHDNPEDLEINTLDNAIYMNMKNDTSFVFDMYLNLYEHQSTFNPNMPLRNLFYIARILERRTARKARYNSTLIKIPTPKFVVFYNGTATQPARQILKLSDAFEKTTDTPDLELTVLMLNINPGMNLDIVAKCKTFLTTKRRRYR